MTDVARILAGFRSTGFALVSVQDSLVERLLRLAGWLYSKSLEERLGLAAFRTTGVLGYYPCEDEAVVAGERSGDAVPVFEGKRARGYCSYDYVADDQILGASELFTANLWPADDAFRLEACSLYDVVGRFTKEVSRSLVAHLRRVEHLTEFVDEDSFVEACCSIMRLLKYTQFKDGKVSKPHTDYEFISLVVTNAEGLEVRSPNGIWTMVPRKEGKAVLLPGDMLQAATGGFVQSSLHRVRFGLEDRLAVIFFQGMKLGQEIAYEVDGRTRLSTFGKHLCTMLVRGAPHLRSELASWERTIGARIPDSNPFRRGKEDCEGD